MLVSVAISANLRLSVYLLEEESITINVLDVTMVSNGSITSVDVHQER